MNGSSKHTLYGVIFIAACVILAGIVYAVIRSPAPTPLIENTSVADMRIGQPEAPSTPVASPSHAYSRSTTEEAATPDNANDDSTSDMSSAAFSMFPEYRFSDYPAPAIKGPARIPTFTGPQKDFVDYQTAILTAARNKPSFAGRISVASVGCGSGCVRYFFIDTSNGEIVEHQPANAGSGDVQYDELTIRPDSLLAFESYQRLDDNEQTQCIYNAYRWTAGRLVLLGSKSVSFSPTEPCTRADQ